MPVDLQKMPSSVWREVQEKLSGSESEKLEAIEILTDGTYRVPRDAYNKIVELAGGDQTESVRIKLASLVAEGKLPYRLHSRLVEALEADPNPAVQEHLESDRARIQRASEIFQAIATQNQSVLDAVGQVTATAESARAVAAQTARIQEIAQSYGNWIKLQQELLSWVAREHETVRQFLTVGRNIEPLLEAGRQAERMAAMLANYTALSYYPASELELAETPPEEPIDEEGQTLASRLTKVPPGQAGWYEYQDVCEDILNYCLAPPLIESTRQSPTSGRLQVRDLLLHIPHEAEGLWRHISSRFEATAIIVECKNYTNELRSNQVVITSKYLGAKRLGRFGMIISRKGLGSGGKREQTRLWLEDDKLILSLTDQDLRKMLELKGAGEDPGKVIDSKLRRFLEGLE